MSSFFRKVIGTRGFFATLSLLFGLFFLLYQFFVHYLFHYFPRLTGEAPYEFFSIIIGGINSSGVLLGYVLVVVVFAWAIRSISWSDYEWSSWRYLTVVLSLGLAWGFSFYGYNYFFDRGHYLDRAVIVLLAVATFYNPAFLFLFVPLTLVVASQLHFGSFVFPFAEEHLLVSILIFLAAGVLLKTVRDVEDRTLLFGLLLVLGGNFFGPALSRLLFQGDPGSWFANFSLANDFAFKHFVGWMNFSPESSFRTIVDFLSTYNQPLLIGIVVFEMGTLFLLLSYKVTLLYLLLFVFFHLGFFLLSGVLFAKWIFVYLSLLIFLLVVDRRELRGLYDRYSFRFPVWMVLLVLLGLIPFKEFSWGGTRYHLDYDLVGVTEQGKEYPLSERSFPPYGRYFRQSYLRFHFLAEDRKLFGPSYRDHQTARKLNELIESTMEIKRIKENYGVNFYDPEYGQFFDRFVRTYLNNFYDANRSRPLDLFRFGGRYFSNTYSAEKYTPEEIPGRLAVLKVRMREGYFRDNENHLLEETVIRTVRITGRDKKKHDR